MTDDDTKTRLIVCGGRDYTDRDYVFQTLDAFVLERKRGKDGLVIIEGGATGADALAREWAEARGVPVDTFRANWKNVTAPGAVVRAHADGSLYNAAAGRQRNVRMLHVGQATAVMAFPGGKGTAHMIRIAREDGVPVFAVPPKGISHDQRH